MNGIRGTRFVFMLHPNLAGEMDVLEKNDWCIRKSPTYMTSSNITVYFRLKNDPFSLFNPL